MKARKAWKVRKLTKLKKRARIMRALFAFRLAKSRSPYLSVASRISSLPRTVRILPRSMFAWLCWAWLPMSFS